MLSDEFENKTPVSEAVAATDAPGFTQRERLERMMSYTGPNAAKSRDEWALVHEVERLLKELKNRDALLREAAVELRVMASRLRLFGSGVADKIEAALGGRARPHPSDMVPMSSDWELASDEEEKKYAETKNEDLPDGFKWRASVGGRYRLTRLKRPTEKYA